MNAALYDRLGALLRYPDAAYLADVDSCGRLLEAEEPALAARVERFAAGVRDIPLADLEELFTRTFDINPVCTLEVGWQLFGEEYERGTFLVRMREEMRRLGLPESTELPDHLTHVLAVLGRMAAERADDFATACVLPAVERMCTSLAGKDVPYEHALDAIRTFLMAHHGAALGDGAARVAEAGTQPSAPGME
ncbi:MAG: molecular chaperone TorD family protein [Candidatus Binatia bacterium]